MSSYAIHELVLETGAQECALTSQILSRLPNVPVIPRIESFEREQDSVDYEKGKKSLHLVSHKGAFLKPCPGTKGYMCCGYQILHVGTNCPLDCSYCILQSYLQKPYLTAFANLAEQLENVLSLIDLEPQKLFRIGTGEFTDSLAIDPITGWSELLVAAFSMRKNALLELKTKTDRVRQLLSYKYRDRIVVSWSLNSPYVATREEHRAPSLTKRLIAARQCQSEGFAVGFHFDPLIHHPRWKEEYMKTLDLMDQYVDPNGIIWISLGAFRFMPRLKWIIRSRHPQSCVLDGEFVVGLDGKMRYFKPIRVDLYCFMRETLEKWHKDLGLYLCMEGEDIWEKSLGWSPRNSTDLAAYLDRRAIQIFGDFQ